MDFIASLGSLALGSRLKRLSDHMIGEVEKAYQALGIDLQPRFFPMISFLIENGPSGITEISRSLQVSHPAISQMTTKLVKAGLVVKTPDPDDERRQLVSLSEKGQVMVNKLQPIWPTIREVVDEMINRSHFDLLQGIQSLEAELEKASMADLILERHHQKQSEQEAVQIVGWDPQYKLDFDQLNRAWITQYFEMTSIDEKALSNPEQYYLAKGGHIFFARQSDHTVGCCALARVDSQAFELCKLAVSPDFQNQGIAHKLMDYVIKQAALLQAQKVILETNSQLLPAMHLYRTLGFVEKQHPNGKSIYERADVFMELTLN